MSRRILVVDDDWFLADLVATTLRSQGWTVHLAGSRAEALAVAAECAPDLLLLDIVLPDGTGWMLLRELRHGPLPVEVPVVVVSSMPVTRSELRRHGAHGFVPKPLSMSHLLNTVRALLEGQV